MKNDNRTFEQKLEDFADLISEQTEACYRAKGYAWDGCERNWQINIKPGKKYFKIDVGHSGKYMVDSCGKIFGIKAYGVINKKKQYGTLETIENYFWGEFVAIKINK